MTQQVEFYYDFGSPNAYLAWTQLPALCARYNAELVYRPVLLGGVFKSTGNETPVRVPQKRAWLFDDMARFAARYGVPLNPNPHFIFNSLGLMRGAIWAIGAGCIEPYNKAMYTACWVDGRNVEDADEIATVLGEAGIDAAAVFEAIQQPEIKTALIDATAAAVDRGVFGVPTMFVGGEMHFGQDRLDWVERALAAGSD